MPLLVQQIVLKESEHCYTCLYSPGKIICMCAASDLNNTVSAVTTTVRFILNLHNQRYIVLITGIRCSSEHARAIDTDFDFCTVHRYVSSYTHSFDQKQDVHTNTLHPSIFLYRYIQPASITGVAKKRTTDRHCTILMSSVSKTKPRPLADAVGRPTTTRPSVV